MEEYTQYIYSTFKSARKVFEMFLTQNLPLTLRKILTCSTIVHSHSLFSFCKILHVGHPHDLYAFVCYGGFATPSEEPFKDTGIPPIKIPSCDKGIVLPGREFTKSKLVFKGFQFGLKISTPVVVKDTCLLSL